MIKKLFKKLFGLEMVEVTYKIIDLSPPYACDEDAIKTVVMRKTYRGRSIKSRLPDHGMWYATKIISVKDV